MSDAPDPHALLALNAYLDFFGFPTFHDRSVAWHYNFSGPYRKVWPALGRALAEVVNKDACANPAAFDWYVGYAGRFKDMSTGTTA